MSSKWNPWDFFKSHPRELKANDFFVSALSFFDPFVEDLFKSKLRVLLSNQKELRLYLGSEITTDWWEGEWKTLDFFSSECFYLVISAGDIPKNAQAMILEDLKKTTAEDGIGKEICFCFSGSHAFFDALAKQKIVDSHKIEAPKFWEWNKYLLFLAEEKKFPLNYETEQFLLDVLTPSGEEFSRAIDILKLTFGTPERLTREDLKKVFQNEHVDFFQMASFFGGKSFQKFYEDLIPFAQDLELMRSLSSFMQTHLLKILDPSYTQDKNRLSKYDQEIVAHSKRWKPRELMVAIRFFGNLEKMAKEGSSQLSLELKEKYFEVLSPVRPI